jgi:tRNA(Leu) C34 or U34 (ribose-2'-O)-methylase TrmL
MRGFYGIGIYHPKNEVNMGTLWRSAFLYNADFIFTIGKRYQHQASDTTKAFYHVPLWEFQSFEDFKKSMPRESRLICVELSKKARQLDTFIHPERACYLLGAEDNGIPEDILYGHTIIQIPTENAQSMNVSTAGTIILYDRFIKRRKI